MILEIESNTRKINLGLDASSAKLLGVTDTRALKNQRRRKRTATNDNLLSSTEDSRLQLVRVQRLGRNSLNTNGTTILHDDLVDLRVAGQVQVTVLGACGMDIGVR